MNIVSGKDPVIRLSPSRGGSIFRRTWNFAELWRACCAQAIPS